MSATDRFGDPEAMEAALAACDDCIANLAKADLGCGSCESYIPSEYDENHGMCVYGLREAARRYRLGLRNTYPFPDLVEAHGYVPCEYETYSPK